MNPLDRLLAQDAILKTCHQLLYAEDELDRKALLSCLHPTKKITLDMSQHMNIPATEITPSEYWEQVHSLLGGFMATQHFTGNSIVTFDEGDEGKAKVKQFVIAYLCIQEDGGEVESTTVRVTQEVWMDWCIELGRWVVTGLVLRRNVPLVNGELYQRALERGKKPELLRKPKGET